MSTDDDVPVIRSAARATQRTADVTEVQTALGELHALIFGGAETHDTGNESLLSCIHDLRVLLNRDEVAKRRDLDTVRLLIEALATLSEMLIGAAEGRRTHRETVKRLKDVVLPILFLRSGITAHLLRAHALRLPWIAFQNACRVSGKEVDKVRHIFALWRSKYGWDFMTREDCIPKPCEKASVKPLVVEVSVEAGRPEPAPRAPDSQRAMLRDISWNAAAKRGVSAGIPSYMLSKRRPSDVFSQGKCSSSPMPAASCANTAVTHTPHTPIDNLDTKSGAKVLALESPVKRRRIDFNVGIPPSPDRPGRYL